jgi:hypothetical protein
MAEKTEKKKILKKKKKETKTPEKKEVEKYPEPTAEEVAGSCLGETEANAIKYIEEKKYKARVVRRDNEHFMCTCDFDLSRINLVIILDTVTASYLG